MKLLPFKINTIQQNIEHLPYGITQCQAPSIWETGEKGQGVVVAILDTGIDINHPDLRNRIIDGKNFTPEGDHTNFYDMNGHGTHVAGTIAGEKTGVAPSASLLICKVLDRHGSGSYDSIIDGLNYARKWKGANGEKVRVINMSLGGSQHSHALESAILNAVSEGILVVVASGNEGDNREETFEQAYPALYNECITVSACDENKKLAPFSNTHLQVDIIAAGIDVYSTYPVNQYAKLSGTSMATPHISGMLALIINIGEKQFKRTLTESEIYALLVKCSCSLGYEKSSEGNGLPQLKEVYKHC